MISKKTSLLLLIGITLLTFGIGLLSPPIPQPQDYHNFADQRPWLGINNAWNVLSNAGIAFAGIWGLYLLFSPSKVQFVDDRERWPWVGLAIGLILTAIGSGYYHLAPDNSRLVWDRLPMTLIFTSYMAAMIGSRINMTLGLCLWPILACVGFYSVLDWYAGELRGSGDLRLFIGVQLYAFIGTVPLVLTSPPYDRTRDLSVVALFFVLARVFEIEDYRTSSFNEGLISGHTMKHFMAALSAFWLIRMVHLRKIIHKNSIKSLFLRLFNFFR